MIKAVIFDVGEVLLRGMMGFELVLNEKYGLKLALNHFDIEELEKFFHGKITEIEYWEAILAKYDWGLTIDQLKKEMRNNFREVEGTREIVKKLKRSGYKLGLLSVHAKEWVEYLQEQYGYHELFDSISYSFEAVVSKPDKKAYETILNKLQVKPKECLFIDDNPKNTEAAKLLGINTILFQDHVQLQEDLKSMGIKLNQ